MQLKQVTSIGNDGQLETSLYLVDESTDKSIVQHTSSMECDLGSQQVDGMHKVEQHGNAINSILVAPAKENVGDSVVSSKSYGVVYLIEQMLNNNGFQLDQLIPSEVSTPQNKSYRILPALITALLSRDTETETKVNSLSRRIFFPSNVNFTASTLRSLILELQHKPFISDFLKSMDMEVGFESDCNSEKSATTAEINDNRYSHSFSDEELITKSITEKLQRWIISDQGSWCSFEGEDGISEIVTLAIFLLKEIEAQTGVLWDDIYDHMSTLHIITIESDEGIILLTTRPTSKQLGIFYRLKIDPPPLMFSERPNQERVENAKKDTMIIGNAKFDYENIGEYIVN